MSDDPYQSPGSVGAAGSVPVVKEPLDTTARRVFLAWEKLRIVYVLWLVLVTVATALAQGFDSPGAVGVFLEIAFVGAIGASLAYFAGPAVETYATWLGYRGQMLRWTLQRFTLTCGRVGRERAGKTGIPTSQNDYNNR